MPLVDYSVQVLHTEADEHTVLRLGTHSKRQKIKLLNIMRYGHRTDRQNCYRNILLMIVQNMVE